MFNVLTVHALLIEKQNIYLQTEELLQLYIWIMQFFLAKIVKMWILAIKLFLDDIISFFMFF